MKEAGFYYSIDNKFTDQDFLNDFDPVMIHFGSQI
jgi:hypothetical protein